jgi:hypothetical protein
MGGDDVKKKDFSTISEALRDALLAYSGLEPISAYCVVIAQRLFGGRELRCHRTTRSRGISAA